MIKKLLSCLLLVCLFVTLMPSAPFTAAAAPGNLWYKVTEVGAAALDKKDIRVSKYPYAYEVKFYDDNGNEITKFDKPQKVYLPYDNMADQLEKHRLVAFLLEGDHEKCVYGRFIETSFMFEVLVDKPGLYTIKNVQPQPLNLGDFYGDVGALDAFTIRNVIRPSAEGFINTSSALTRIEFFAIISRLLELESDAATSRFKDIPNNNIFIKEIEAAADLGIVKGYDGKFMPNNIITRAEAAVIVANILKYINGYNVSTADGKDLDFSDAADIPSWAVNAAGVVGKTYKIFDVSEGFNPKGTVNRADLASSMYSMMFLVPLVNSNSSPIADAGAATNFAGKNEAGVESYPAFYGAPKSERYTLTANGVEVFVEDKLDANIARLSVSGKTDFVLTANEPIAGITVSPRVKGIDVLYHENIAKFTADGPQKLFIQVGNNENLFVFAETVEQNKPSSSGRDVFNVVAEGADPTGTDICTAAIQKALDKASAAGGTVYFPNGRYKSGSINIKSNTKVYFEPSAIVYGGSEKDDYVTMFKNSSAFVNMTNAENITIYGRGGFDLNGSIKQMTFGNFGRSVILTNNVKNLTIKDVQLWDSGGWNTHLVQSSNISIDNIKIINNRKLVYTDGIDPNWSNNVTVTNSFLHCDDDPLVVKSTKHNWIKYDAEKDFVYNMVFKGNILYTHASALKIGTEGYSSKTYNIVFEDNDVISADRAIAGYVRDNTELTDVRWINNRIERIDNGVRALGSEQLFYFVTERRNGVQPITDNARIHDLLVKDVYARMDGPNGSGINAFSTINNIKGITFENINIAGKRINSIEELRIDISENVSDVVVK